MAKSGPRWQMYENAVPVAICADVADRVEWETLAASERGSREAGLPSIVDVDDPRLVQLIWDHISELVPQSVEGWDSMGAHSTARLLRYEAPCEGAAPTAHPLHADTPVVLPGRRSRLTALVYVSGGFQGGALQLAASEGGKTRAIVHADIGTVVIFDHALPHRAEPVLAGVKRVLKLSLLYADSRGGFDKDSSEVVAEHRSVVEEVREVVKNAPGSEERLERLLGFLLREETSAWPQALAESAFMPLLSALGMPNLRLKAYEALVALTPLHGSEMCLLLGETLCKDCKDADPVIRAAALGTLFSGVAACWPEELRQDMVCQVLRHDPDPAVVLQAVEHLAALAERPELGGARSAYKEALARLADDADTEADVAAAALRVGRLFADLAEPEE